MNDGNYLEKNKEGYEEKMWKLKDEREEIKKKKLKKWVKKKLKKERRNVGDMLVEIKDGKKII